MRILIHGINFSPESTGIGKYTGELAEWLASRGHEVRVVTAPPYYPEWRVGAGYSAWRYRRETNGKGASRVMVYRCPLWVPSSPSGLKRVIHLISFSLSSFPIMVAQVFWRPNVVLAIEPAFFSVPQACLTARLSGAKAWLHVQDFEVDAAFELGLLPGGKVRAMAHMLERWMMRRFDRVSAISRRMVERLVIKGVEPRRSVLVPNWVDIAAVFPMEEHSTFRAKLGIPEGKIVVLYSGNMGKKQGLEVLLEAARLLSSEARVQFVFCGEGAVKRHLLRSFSNLPNVTWLPLQPVECLNDLLNMADIHALPQRADAADLVMPSKLTSMLASGRPVIATANPGTEVARTVSGCGLVVEPGDPTYLAQAILRLAYDPDARKRCGQAARDRALTSMCRDAVLGRLEEELTECVNGRSWAPQAPTSTSCRPVERHSVDERRIAAAAEYRGTD